MRSKWATLWAKDWKAKEYEVLGTDREEGLFHASSRTFDLIILDVMQKQGR
jgi:DNA-binding response OmpR family regulator